MKHQHPNSGRQFRLGLVVNPMAGIGGAVALKGSDGTETVTEAIKRGATSQVGVRLATFLAGLADAQALEVLTVGGPMGQQQCEAAGLTPEVVTLPKADPTTPEDTRRAAIALSGAGVDLLVFAGGDGTARDVFDVLGDRQVVLGVPCGVKMHSGVFANNPAVAAEIVNDMVSGRLVSAKLAEVRDIDEASFRSDRVMTRFYGEMWVPEELRYLQNVKAGGKEVEALVVEEIAADILERMAEDDANWFLGSGSTTAAISEALGLPYTLLGVDVVKGGELILADATAPQLLELAEQGPCKIVVTAIGGQGHIFGRGNQQFSAAVIRAVGALNIIVIATKTKLEALGGKPLQVDTGDRSLDADLSGPVRVVTGYEDAVFYPVES